MKDYLNDIKSAKEVAWINPHKLPAIQALADIEFTRDDIEDASKRLERFAPLIMHYFPETAIDNGIIESPLKEINNMLSVLNKAGSNFNGRLFLKQDSDLKVAGSVKARGGVYEVLKHSEDLAFEAGILQSYDDDYLKLASSEARDFFSQHKMQVGSTGNLGLSIGIMSAAIGYEAIIHMSVDAKQWKKDLLRQKGATAIEYDGDYGAAVEAGRARSDADPASYFVDDENSTALFLGYAVAAQRTDSQLRDMNIFIDENHPLFVYIPCGVGGAPGGIAFGMKQLYGDNVHVFFVEPTQCPCMLVGLATGKMSDICVQDIGLTGKTEADGLAVARPSGLVSRFMDTLLSGEFTVDDSRLNDYLKNLFLSEGIFIEPSSCASFIAPERIYKDSNCTEYIKENGLTDKMKDSVHILWATGGSMVPENIRQELLNN